MAEQGQNPQQAEAPRKQAWYGTILLPLGVSPSMHRPMLDPSRSITPTPALSPPPKPSPVQLPNQRSHISECGVTLAFLQEFYDKQVRG